MDQLQYDKTYKVHLYETGPDGRLNLHSLFNYLQDIASDHAVLLGFGRDDLMKNNRFWVLSRMYSVFSEWPIWGDSIIVTTWPAGTDNLFAMRNYEIKYPDGKPIASASSSWLILDQLTKKIQRPDVVLSDFHFKHPDKESTARPATKLHPADQNGTLTTGFRVKTSDLDVNLHTNNVKYLNWVYDTYDLDFVIKNVPQSAEMNYLAESIFNEEISIRVSQESDSGSFRNHSIIRTNDNKELCRIRIEWKEDSPKKVK